MLPIIIKMQKSVAYTHYILNKMKERNHKTTKMDILRHYDCANCWTLWMTSHKYRSIYHFTLNSTLNKIEKINFFLNLNSTISQNDLLFWRCCCWLFFFSVCITSSLQFSCICVWYCLFLLKRTNQNLSYTLLDGVYNRLAMFDILLS